MSWDGLVGLLQLQTNSMLGEVKKVQVEFREHSVTHTKMLLNFKCDCELWRKQLKR